VLKHAVEWGYLNRNPADFVHPLKAEKKPIVTWTSEQLRRFLEVASRKQEYHIFLATTFAMVLPQ